MQGEAFSVRLNGDGCIHPEEGRVVSVQTLCGPVDGKSDSNTGGHRIESKVDHSFAYNNVG